jgi:toxin ParE1/3/4
VKAARLHAGAEADLREAIAYYDEQRVGLGAELRRAFEFALQRVRANPQGYAIEDDQGTRYCPLHRFPYAIVYVELENEIWVAAVAHHRRRPRYWAGRRID